MTVYDILYSFSISRINCQDEKAYSIILLSRYHTTHAPSRTFHITSISWYHMDMTMWNGLTSSFLDIDSDIKSIWVKTNL